MVGPEEIKYEDYIDPGDDERHRFFKGRAETINGLLNQAQSSRQSLGALSAHTISDLEGEYVNSYLTEEERFTKQHKDIVEDFDAFISDEKSCLSECERLRDYYEKSRHRRRQV